ncbi:MAG: glycosyltransferase family 4 protein [Candidatus Saccharimonadales bacterium]
MNEVEKQRVAIVCDWLTGIGGAERVVLELHKMYPYAPIYTSQYDPSKIDWFIDADVRTTWLQKLPKNLKKFLPVLRAWTFSHLDLSSYDLVISSSGAEAKAVKTGKNTIHISYCHAPTHYYWSRYEEYIKNPGFGIFDAIARLGLRLLVGPMRKWDHRAAQNPTILIANSSYTQEKIKQYYNRESTVIFPPVNILRFPDIKKIKRQGFLIIGRQTPYKKIDLAVSACTNLNLPLTVIGNGPEHGSLLRIAGPSVRFITNASDELVATELLKAWAFIFPGIDDFGIVAVEALASGAPVIAYAKGGALDYINKETGLLFRSQTIESLEQILTAFNKDDFDSVKIRRNAQKYSDDKFVSSMKQLISNIPT